MRLRIYLVEDNPVIRKNLTEWFEDLENARLVGFSTTENEARAWLVKNKTAWDLAVVDLFLAQGSGLGIVKSCRDRNLKQKLVVLTNYATAEIRERSLALGADAIFDKSNELEEFLRYAMEEVERQQEKTRF
jgi:two-component system, OmpR family, response regulator